MPSNDAEDEDPDIIPIILNEAPFKLKPEAEKLRILTSGRPTPKINVTKRDSSRNCNKVFQDSWYSVHPWLCGSKTQNKLFCWPCSLMRPETSSWCSTGTNDIKKFTSLASKHEVCKSHLKAIAEYDETLTSFNLPPEFQSILKLKCKEEETSPDLSDGDNFMTDMFPGNKLKNKKGDSELQGLVDESSKSNEEVKKTSSQLTKSKYKITFKNWLDMKKDESTCNSLSLLENIKLYKWKKKIAKQEFRNARLEGEKLKFEIEMLKAKIEYYKGLKNEFDSRKEESQQ